MKLVYRKDAVDFYQNNKEETFIISEMAKIKIWAQLLILFLSLFICIFIYQYFVPHAQQKSITCANSKISTMTYIEMDDQFKILSANNVLTVVSKSTFTQANTKQLCQWADLSS